MKAILIARVSTEEQKEAGNSLPAQLARLERYCQGKNFKVLQSFSFDESAYTDDREDFDRIINFINQQKEKTAVCCDKVDRLSRNIFDKRISLLYEKALKDEIELHFVSDGQIITSQISAVEKFNFGISLGLAKYYSDAISDNIKRANEQKLRKGELPGKAPYGYSNIINAEGKKDIVVDEYKSLVVKKVFELYATATFSMESLRQKIKDDFGIVWSQGFIDFILKTPFYYGEMKRNNQLYPHRYQPIITRELFDKVQQVKASFRKQPVKLATIPYIYRGLLRCAKCDLAITAERHKGHVYYHCTQYNGKHNAKWFREEEITEQFSKAFKRLQMPKDVAQQIKDTINEAHAQEADFHNKQLTELTKEHQSLTTMMDNLYLDKLKGRITESAYDKFYQQFKEQLEEINSKINRLEAADANYYIVAKRLIELTNKAQELFMGSEVDEKRQLIKLVLSNLKVDDENIVYDAIKPFDLIMESHDCQIWCAW